jgi:cyclohexa-1,5-dienecarbonyl-CoA hydratase
MNERIEVHKEDRFGTITLRAGELNVLGTDDVRALTEAIHELGTCTVVVLQAEGKAFCAGMDVADHLPEHAHHMLCAFNGLAKALHDATPVTIAKVHAAAVGGGFELALLCDVIVASEHSRFSLPEVKLAALPPVACALLRESIGQKRALDLILTGRSVEGPTAERWGMVTRCVPHEQLQLATDDLCHELLALSEDALVSCKSAARTKSVDEAIHLYEHSLLRTHDGLEGMRAFLEKREPHWQSRKRVGVTR